MMVGNFVIRLTLMVWTTNLKSKFKNICVVTGTRAEYGLLSPLMHLIKNDSRMELYVIATGSHLSPEFGLTSIINDGLKLIKK